MTDEEKTMEEKPSKLRERLHRLADSMANGLETAGSYLGKATDRAGRGINHAMEAGTRRHEEIQKSGGYIAGIRSVTQGAEKSIKKFYKNVEESFFTDGEFDKEKTRRALCDRGQAIERFGKQAYYDLSKLVCDGTEIAGKKYREFFPSDEELKGRYAGIGTHTKLMLRKDFDACLSYHDRANNELPESKDYRSQILEDIKASGSKSKEELLFFYSARLNNAGLFGAFDIHTISKMTIAANSLED
ncbi:hypothetical protein HY450_02590 [Candidatus Pacearchaeota archaeon]|nr:hypothetical protein [Candidatus Pacearchaeota archaeon]